MDGLSIPMLSICFREEIEVVSVCTVLEFSCATYFCLCLFNTIVGGICILKFSSDYFRDIIIKTLILYPEMSLKLFLNSNSFVFI